VPLNVKAIVDRLETYGEFEITYFGDDTILNKPIAEWPACDCLLSWHSDGFPLGKVAIAQHPECSLLPHHSCNATSFGTLMGFGLQRCPAALLQEKWGFSSQGRHLRKVESKK
jgi:hypothetical protein